MLFRSNGSFVAQTSLVADARPRIPAPGFAVGGNPDHLVTRLDSVSVGPWTIARPVVGWSVSLERGGDAGTVGAELLRRFRVIFDYTRERIILERTAALADESVFDASGLMVVATGERFDTLQVFSVSPDSPAAESGLQPGDRIVDWSVTDDSLSLGALRRRLGTPGERVDLVVERDGARQVVAITMKPRI